MFYPEKMNEEKVLFETIHSLQQKNQLKRLVRIFDVQQDAIKTANIKYLIQLRGSDHDILDQFKSEYVKANILVLQKLNHSFF